MINKELDNRYRRLLTTNIPIKDISYTESDKDFEDIPENVKRRLIEIINTNISKMKPTASELIEKNT